MSTQLETSLQDKIERLEKLCAAERDAVPGEALRQLADAEEALTRAMEECRAALCQYRQARVQLV